MRAKPKSFTDTLSQAHDDQVPGSQLSGDLRKHRSADAHYYKHWGEGLLTGKGGFYKKPLDSIVIGGVGSALFLTHEVCFTRGALLTVICTSVVF